MATIRKRGSSWQVQIRRRGFPTLVRTFSAYIDAVTWARDQDRTIDRAETPVDWHSLRKTTIADLLSRYGREITPQKRGSDRELYKLKVIRSHPIASATLDKVSGATIASYRNDRLKVVMGSTVRRELAVLQHCFEVARREWDIPIALNPVRQVKLPPASKGRQRRLMPEDHEAFWNSVARARAPWVRPFIILAIETGMRRGELLAIHWNDVDLVKRLAVLKETKNGERRTVPLTPFAVATLTAMECKDGVVFKAKISAVRQAWLRLVKRANLFDIRLHDLRHEAVSRFFELGLSTQEVALISGHRDLRMLNRYTHLRPETVALKLQSILEGDQTPDD